MFAYFAEHLRFLDAVDSEIGFKIDVEVDHVLGVSGLFDDKRHQKLLKRCRVDRSRRGDGGAASGNLCGRSGWLNWHCLERPPTAPAAREKQRASPDATQSTHAGRSTVPIRPRRLPEPVE